VAGAILSIFFQGELMQIQIVGKPIRVRGRQLLAAAVRGICVIGLCAAVGHRAAGDDLPTLKFGMSTALSGPAADLGIHMREGVATAFEEVNAAGGIHGAQLELVALDDGYEPARTAPNMHQLIDQEKVLAIVGNVGTPTAITAIPISNDAKTLFFGAFTGAGVLRKTPPDRYVINYRASYAEETAAMVDALVAHGVKAAEIGFFTQRDAYGDAGFSGGMQAVKKYGLTDVAQVAHVRYERNTEAVEGALADLLTHEPVPRAVIMVGAYAPCAKFIRLAKQNSFNPLFLNVSFVGSSSLAKALASDGDGVVVTQVVPHFDADLPLVKQYRQALARFSPKAEPTFGSLEGYAATQILIRALQSTNGPITRETIVETFESLGEFDGGLGAPLRLAPDEHQASHRVWPTVLRDGKAVAIDWQSFVPLTGANARAN
jgi:ABC-type branched-subunit amino acid transport system substrate-binding protein